MDPTSEQPRGFLMDSLKAFLAGKLKIKVNEIKSRVARPWEGRFLGYRTTEDQRRRLKAAGEPEEGFNDKAR